MMKARIYKPAQTAMQSGMAKTDTWVLEYESHANRSAEPLMGWVQSADTAEQVRIKFDTLDKAKNFAENKGLIYTVSAPHTKVVKPRNYSDNFKYRPPKDQKT